MNHTPADIPLVNIHVHRPETPPAIGVVSVRLTAPGQTLPSVPFSLGIHPWDAERVDEAALLTTMEADSKAIAIGEIGLDRACEADFGAQVRLFEAQLALAVRKELPVVLHSVRAFETVMEMLSAHRLRGVVLHGFTGSPEQAATATRHGCYLSFGERTFVSPRAQTALHSVPSERLFLETDDSPVSIAEIYSRVATLRGVSVPELTESLYRNYLTLFTK